MNPIGGSSERILLTWFNGSTPSWSLPGGAWSSTSRSRTRSSARHEETGYDVELTTPLVTQSSTAPARDGRRPFKSVRILYGAHVVGGKLGTLEVGGTTDFAAWVPFDDVPLDPPTPDIVLLAVEHARQSR
jgi:8-oxo-dGTP diphosphatase